MLNTTTATATPEHSVGSIRLARPILHCIRPMSRWPATSMATPGAPAILRTLPIGLGRICYSGPNTPDTRASMAPKTTTTVLTVVRVRTTPSTWMQNLFSDTYVLTHRQQGFVTTHKEITQ